MLERIAAGRTDRVFDHLDAGGSANAADAQGVPLISWCAYYGDVSAIRALVARGATLAALGEDLGIHAAAFHGHWRLVEYLLENGADADATMTDTGETPLHSALCVANRPAQALVVDVLLAAGAGPDRATKPDAPTGAFMRDARTRGETPLHRAAAYADAATIGRLLDAGARVDAKDSRGETPLAWASWHLRPDAILRLLLHGTHVIHPARDSRYDHGAGWRALDADLLGRPDGVRTG
ncbi:MAG: ankyrin repeat domain-containing protein [Burkholderiales bacterium]|nr:ankyrin repeat domain-containing protein [Burkholderiales bacterium]